jgi:hypothetical protein
MRKIGIIQLPGKIIFCKISFELKRKLPLSVNKTGESYGKFS